MGKEINELLLKFNLYMRLEDGIITAYDINNLKKPLTIHLNSVRDVESLSLEEAIRGDICLSMGDVPLSITFAKGENPPVIEGMHYMSDDESETYVTLNQMGGVSVRVARFRKSVPGQPFETIAEQEVIMDPKNGDFKYTEGGISSELHDGLDDSEVARKICSLPHFKDFIDYYGKVYPRKVKNGMIDTAEKLDEYVNEPGDIDLPFISLAEWRACFDDFLKRVNNEDRSVIGMYPGYLAMVGISDFGLSIHEIQKDNGSIVPKDVREELMQKLDLMYDFNSRVQDFRNRRDTLKEYLELAKTGPGPNSYSGPDPFRPIGDFGGRTN